MKLCKGRAIEGEKNKRRPARISVPPASPVKLEIKEPSTTNIKRRIDSITSLYNPGRVESFVSWPQKLD